MLRLAAVFTAFLLVCSSACQSLKKQDPPKPPLSKCKEDLAALRDARPALKPRKQDDQSEFDTMEGLQLALTIEGMITSQADPSADPDDWCYTENNRENFDKLVLALKQRAMPPTVAFALGSNVDQTLAHE